MFAPNKKTRCFFLVSALLCLLPPAGIPASSPIEKMTVNLYFPHRDRDGLGALTMEMRVGGNLTENLGQLLELYFKGPETNLLPAFPDGVNLRQVLTANDGIAYVDLVKKNGTVRLGALEEWQGLAGMVNTICLNFDEINMVKILVNGDEALSLFGHVDLSYPLLPDKSIITK